MYVLIWEYQVKTDRVAEFEEIYSADGAWTKLFRKSKGYLETELLGDVSDPQRYITIDRWITAQEYETFRSDWKTEYAAIDAQCEGLTERETSLGKLETDFHETR
jgi:heme-degrading monooxygenase HmoA